MHLVHVRLRIVMLEEMHLLRRSGAAAEREVAAREQERAAVKFMSPHSVAAGVLFGITNATCRE